MDMNVFYILCPDSIKHLCTVKLNQGSLSAFSAFQLSAFQPGTKTSRPGLPHVARHKNFYRNRQELDDVLKNF
jgi:hypothetical protein